MPSKICKELAGLLNFSVEVGLLFPAEQHTAFSPRGDDLLAKCAQVAENFVSFGRSYVHYIAGFFGV